MGTVNLGQVAALIQSVSAEALAEGAAPTARNAGTKANAQLVFGIPQIETLLARIPRKTPKDITSYYTDGTLWQRLTGTDGFVLFEDIKVGDYFQMSRTISAYEKTGRYQTTGSQYVTIADIDGAMYRGDNGINYHHLIMVPGKGFGGTQYFGHARMNAGSTTVGGYKGSEMFTDTIGEVATSGSTATTASINQQLYAEFGSHLKTTRELVSNGINASGYNRFGTATGCASSWEWTRVQAVLMSEIEVYGTTVWSSSGYDTVSACKQLALFQHSELARNNRSSYYWLKDIASATYFCVAHNSSHADGVGANFAQFCVRPRFIIA